MQNRVTGTVREVAWVLGKASVEIQGDDRRTYVHLADTRTRLWVGSRVRFAVKVPSPAPVYAHTPERVTDRSVPQAVELEVL